MRLACALTVAVCSRFSPCNHLTSPLPPPACSTLDVCAGQAPVAMHHWLSDADAARLRDSGAPIAVYIARRDSMMSPSAQAQLARLLGARTLDTDSAHMVGGACLASGRGGGRWLRVRRLLTLLCLGLPPSTMPTQEANFASFEELTKQVAAAAAAQ